MSGRAHEACRTGPDLLKGSCSRMELVPRTEKPIWVFRLLGVCWRLVLSCADCSITGGFAVGLLTRAIHNGGSGEGLGFEDCNRYLGMQHLASREAHRKSKIPQRCAPGIRFPSTRRKPAPLRRFSGRVTRHVLWSDDQAALGGSSKNGGKTSSARS